jgi:maleate isomerase
MWQSDGWDATVRVGILVPHADVGPESEIQSMAPAGVLVHASRVPFGAMAAGGQMDPTIPLAPVEAFIARPHIDAAVELLAGAPLDAMGIAFTSSAYVVGAEREAAAIERLASSSNGIPVVDTCASAVQGLRALGAERLALVSPPWFDGKLDDLGVAYFASQGLHVVAHGPCPLPSSQAKITPAHLYDAVLTSTPDTAEAVFIGGNGFRSVGVIAALESALERPVLTANQALLWGLLHTVGADVRISGYGRLLGGLMD